MKVTDGAITFLIDEIDADLVEGYNWALVGKYIYVTVEERHPQPLYREIAKRLGLSLANDIDHKDGNPMNCKRDNLREATRSQNQANRKLQCNNTTGFKGVTKFKGRNKWFSKITVDGKHIHLGSFDTPEDAHAAYCKAATKHFGEFARFE